MVPYPTVDLPKKQAFLARLVQGWLLQFITIPILQAGA